MPVRCRAIGYGRLPRTAGCKRVHAGGGGLRGIATAAAIARRGQIIIYLDAAISPWAGDAIGPDAGLRDQYSGRRTTEQIDASAVDRSARDIADINELVAARG